MNFRTCAVMIVAVASFSGCATSGLFPSTHMTQVELSEGNYRIVATNVAGEADASYLIGVSFSKGFVH